MRDLSGLARPREADAYDQRYKHGKAARTWDALSRERPENAPLHAILAAWMAAYEAADAEAERAFRELAASTPDPHQ